MTGPVDGEDDARQHDTSFQYMDKNLAIPPQEFDIKADSMGDRQSYEYSDGSTDIF
jgi:hypothetical protein